MPAHRGFAANSYADAAAKACTTAPLSNVSDMVRDAIRWKKYVQEVWVEHEGSGGGRWEGWDEAVYSAVREATGWWVVAKEVAKAKRAEKTANAMPHHSLSS